MTLAVMPSGFHAGLRKAHAESRQLDDAIRRRGGTYIEAPVLGSVAEVRSSKLIVILGGEREEIDRWLPVLEVFGPSPIYIGPVGHAAAAKLALNQLIGSMTAAFALSVGLALRSGVDVQALMTILRRSALHARTFDKKLPRLLTRDYANPTFPLKHLQKDIQLFVDESAAVGLSTDWVSALNRLLLNAIDSDYAEDDYSALNEMLDVTGPTTSDIP